MQQAGQSRCLSWGGLGGPLLRGEEQRCTTPCPTTPLPQPKDSFCCWFPTSGRPGRNRTVTRQQAVLQQRPRLKNQGDFMLRWRRIFGSGHTAGLSRGLTMQTTPHPNRASKGHCAGGQAPWHQDHTCQEAAESSLFTFNILLFPCWKT